MADAGEAFAADCDWLFDEDELADGDAVNQPATARLLQRISRTSAVLDAAGIACAWPHVTDSRGWCCCSRPAGTSGGQSSSRARCPIRRTAPWRCAARKPRLLRRLHGPPRVSCGIPKAQGGFNGSPMQLEFALAVVWAGYDAVQHIPRVAEQIVCLLRPGHGAHEHVNVDDVGLDGANPGRSIRSQRAQHRHPLGGQPCHAQPGDLGRAPFQVAPAAMLADEVTTVTVQPAKVRVPAARPARRRRGGLGTIGAWPRHCADAADGKCRVTALVRSDHVCENSPVAPHPGSGR
jgi:hypothetical protein